MIAGEAIHGDYLDAVPKLLGVLGQPVGEYLRRTACLHIQQPRRPGALDRGGQIHQDRDIGVLTAAAHVLPLVLIDPQDPHPFQVGGVVIDQRAGGLHREVIDQVPSQAQGPGHGADAHLVDRQPLQDPPGAPVGGLGPHRRTVQPLLEDPLRAPCPGAPIARQAHVQPGGVPGHR